MRVANVSRVPLTMVVLALALIGLTSCYADTGAYVYGEAPSSVGYSYSYADNYPRVWYNGGYSYFINDRWYYPTRQGWAAYVNEPPELRGYRPYVQHSPYVYRAPPAYYGRPTYAPPAYYGHPGYAPPAYYGHPGYAPPAYGRPPGNAPPAYGGPRTYVPRSPPAYAPPAVRVR